MAESIVDNIARLARDLEKVGVSLRGIVLRVRGSCRWGELYTPPVTLSIDDIDAEKVGKAISYIVGIVSGPIFENIKLIECTFDLALSEGAKRVLDKVLEFDIANLGDAYVTIRRNTITLSKSPKDRDALSLIAAINSCIEAFRILLQLV